jgi:hypothetical protein
MKAVANVIGERAAHQLIIALTQLKNNADGINRQFQTDQKCQEVCETLVETASTLIAWLELPGYIRVTVSMQPPLLTDWSQPAQDSLSKRLYPPASEDDETDSIPF